MVLNEKKHVATYRYIRTISKMSEWIKRKVESDFRCEPEQKRFCYLLPKQLTKKIDICSELDIEVNVHNLKYVDSMEKYGSIYIDRTESIDNDKLQFNGSVGMTVNAQISGNGLFYKDTFIVTMVHEINHKYEQLKRLQRNEQVAMQLYRQMDFERELFSKDDDYFDCMSDEACFIREILYLLFIDTEFHAEVASVYGDLFAFNGNIKKDRLDGFARYDYLQGNFHILQDLSESTYASIMNLLSGYILMFDKYKTVQSFNRNFISECANRLENFHERIEQVYRFYYNLKAETLFQQRMSVNEHYHLHRPADTNGRYQKLIVERNEEYLHDNSDKGK